MTDTRYRPDLHREGDSDSDDSLSPAINATPHDEAASYPSSSSTTSRVSLIHMRQLRQITEHQALKSDHPEKALGPFGTQDFSAQEYVQLLMDKRRARERREQWMQQQNQLLNNYGSANSSSANRLHTNNLRKNFMAAAGLDRLKWKRLGLSGSGNGSPDLVSGSEGSFQTASDSRVERPHAAAIPSLTIDTNSSSTSSNSNNKRYSNDSNTSGSNSKSTRVNSTDGALGPLATRGNRLSGVFSSSPLKKLVAHNRTRSASTALKDIFQINKLKRRSKNSVDEDLVHGDLGLLSTNQQHQMQSSVNGMSFEKPIDRPLRVDEILKLRQQHHQNPSPNRSMAASPTDGTMPPPPPTTPSGKGTTTKQSIASRVNAKLLNPLDKLLRIDHSTSGESDHDDNREKYEKEALDHNQLLKTLSYLLSDELKQEVFQHYPLYMTISRSVKDMEQEMLDLTKTWGEMKSQIRDVGDALYHMSKLGDMLRGVDDDDDDDDESQHFVSHRDSFDDSRNDIEMVTPRISRHTTTFVDTMTQSRDDELIEQLQDICHELVSAVNNQDWGYGVTLIESGDAAVQGYMERTADSPHNNSSYSEHPNEITFMVVHTFHENREWFCETLCNALYRPGQAYTRQRRLVQHLMRLTKRSDAIHVFFKVKTEELAKALRYTTVEQQVCDPVSFSRILSDVFFSTVLKTCDQFQELFTGEHTSMFVMWLVKSLDHYQQHMHMHVFGTEYRTLDVASGAMKTALECASILDGKGISVGYLLEDHFRHDIEQTIVEHATRIEENLLHKVNTEIWRDFMYRPPTSNEIVSSLNGNEQNVDTNDTSPLLLCDSGLMLYRFVGEYIANVRPIASTHSYQCIVGTLRSILENYLLGVFTIASEGNFNDLQFFVLASNSHTVVDDLIPRATSQLKEIFKRQIPELKDLAIACRTMQSRLITLYCSIRAKSIADTMQISSADYYPSAFVPQEDDEQHTFDKLTVSKPFTSFVVHLAKLRKVLERFSQLKKSDITFTTLISEFLLLLERGDDRFVGLVSRLRDGSPITAPGDDNESHFSAIEVNQIILDLLFLRKASSTFLDEKTERHFVNLLEKIKATWTKSDNQRQESQIASDKWFEEKIAAVMHVIGPRIS